MHFNYEHMIPKWGRKNIKLIYMETDRYYALKETDNAYKYIIADVEKWIDTSNYNKRRGKIPLPVRKITKMIESIKDKKGGKIITKFATTAPKSYSYTLQKDVQEIEDPIVYRGKRSKKVGKSSNVQIMCSR